MGEAEQLREDLLELYAVMNTLIDDGQRKLVEACEEAIQERLERLAELERDDAA